MAVCDQNPGTVDAVALERGPELVDVAARVDDHGLACVGGGAHDVAVGADRAQFKLVDEQGHGR